MYMSNLEIASVIILHSLYVGFVNGLFSSLESRELINFNYIWSESFIFYQGSGPGGRARPNSLTPHCLMEITVYIHAVIQLLM